MLRIALLTALTVSLPAYAALPDPTPVSAFRSVQSIPDIGKSNEAAVKAAAGAFKCNLKRGKGVERLLANDKGEGCFGTSEATVSFLGANHVTDSYSLRWNFKDRKDFEEAKAHLEQNLKKIYGLAVKSNSGSLFENQIRLSSKTNQTVYLTWSTYGEFIRVDVLETDAQNGKAVATSNISDLVNAFPEGKGKVSDITPFAENWGCVVRETGHPRWLTISTKTEKNCRGLNVYFERNASNMELFDSIKFNPTVPGDKNVKEYEDALSQLYGKPNEVKQPMFDEPSRVYQSGETGIVLNQVMLQDKPNADVTITSYGKMMSLPKPEEKAEEKK